jgi:polyhydroxyalkanoate synthesis regulator phasin
MTDLIQKIIYNSIGVAAVTNEKFKELIEDLIQNNHFTEDEGKRIVDSFLFDTRQQLDSLNATVQVKMDELLKQLGIPKIQTMKKDAENYIRDVKNDPTLLLRLPHKK